MPTSRDPSTVTTAFYDTKPYDRQFFEHAAGAEGIRWQFHEFRLTSETAASVDGARAVCVFVNDRLDRACLGQLQRSGVRLVALRCAGVNNVDIAAAKEFGLAVTRVPAYSPHAVAEHTVGLLLTLNRKIHRAWNRVREHNFSLNGLVGFDIAGKTVGIVGTGRIGRIAAHIFRGFDATVLAFDPAPAPDWARQHGVRYTEFDALLAASDVVSLHLPLTPQSHHLLNTETIGRMKSGAHLINTSRGKLVDTTALIEALKSGRLGGVALDVYEEEEGIFFEDHSGEVLQDDELSRLLTFPNVLITAHQAFLTSEALAEIARDDGEPHPPSRWPALRGRIGSDGVASVSTGADRMSQPANHKFGHKIAASPVLPELAHEETQRVRRPPLDALFAPRNIALIGATDKAGSVGGAILKNLGCFEGAVVPVNPKHQSVGGPPAFPHIGTVPGKVDLAVIATPAGTVPGILRDCAQAGVPAAIIISAGFRECGAAGAELERQCLVEARRGKLRLLGPNCLGLMMPHSRLNASFAEGIAQPGSVAFLSQSGALCSSGARLELPRERRLQRVRLGGLDARCRLGRPHHAFRQRPEHQEHRLLHGVGR